MDDTPNMATSVAVGGIPAERWAANRYAIAAAVSAVAGILTSIAATADPSMLYLALGLWALVIVLLPPALTRNYYLFAPWSFVILTVGVGLPLRGLYVSLGLVDAGLLEDLYLLGRSPEFFAGPGFLLLCGLFILALGYLVPGRGRKRALVEPGPPIVIPRLYLVAVSLLVASAVSTFLYVRNTGGWEPAGLISAKRTPIPDIELAGSDYRSYGYLRFLGGLAIYGHLLVLAEMLRPGGQVRGWKVLLALALFLSACAIPFYASIRSVIAMNFCLSLAMLYYSGRMFSPLRVGAIALLGILMVYVMTTLRSERDDAAALEDLSFSRQVVDAMVLNRNQIDLFKTAHIIDAIPETLDYQHGRTLAIWLAAPVPRFLWPDKPVVQPGPEIGNAIYGQRVAGVPPGIVAELYWNFALPGVIAGCFLFGMLLRGVSRSFSPARGSGDLLRAVIYVGGPMAIGFQAVGSSLGGGIYRAILDLLVVAAIVWVVRGCPLPRREPRLPA